MSLDELLESAESQDLSRSAVEAEAERSGISVENLLERLAVLVAKRFWRDELPYGAADAMANGICAYSITSSIGLSSTARDICQAFDAGEYLLPDQPAALSGGERTRELLRPVLFPRGI